MSIDSNNISHPDYMDIEFFKSILKSGLKDENFVLEHVQFTSGHKPGENYISAVYRADVQFLVLKSNETKKVSLFIKTECLNGEYKTADFFGKEMDTYTFALPEVHSILENVQIAPKLYYVSRKPVDIIVMQDMSAEGYEIGDRVNGLDEEHCRMVLGKLAKYHAASMEIRRTNPQARKLFRESMLNNESKKLYETLFLDTLQDLAKLAKKWPGFETLPDKLLNLRSNIFEILKRTNQAEKEDITVLLQNDLWTNNILFKHEDNMVTDVLLIDFQASFYSSLGIDIIHFLYTTPQFHLLETRRDKMIEEYYYKPFKATLEEMKYSPVPSLEQIYNEIDKREMSGFLWAVAKLYLICMEKDASGDNSIENLADKEMGARIRAKGMASERYQKTMRYIFKRLEKLRKI